MLTDEQKYYLDAVWEQNRKATLILPSGTKLWHGGIVGPNNPATNALGLWTTRDEQGKAKYNGQALFKAKSKGVNAYLTEYETTKDLLLADFNCYGLVPFAQGLCNGIHDHMKHAVIAWITKRELRGIVSINGNVDEVVIGFPENDLIVIQSTQL